MNDCLNAEMRDRLPDLLHDRLSASVRAEVNAHVAACADCREELELLRALNAMLAKPGQRVDIAYVVNALPKPRSRPAPSRIAPRRTWADWRIAAAVTLLVAGGSSVVVLNRGDLAPSGEVVLAPITDTPSTGASGGKALTNSNVTPPAVTAITVAQNDAAGQLGMAGHLADLDDQQLQALIDEIEQMKAVPITEPEPVSIKVDPKGTQSPEVR